MALVVRFVYVKMHDFHTLANECMHKYMGLYKIFFFAINQCKNALFCFSGEQNYAFLHGLIVPYGP